MSRLALGQVGCGGMGLRHVHGLIEAHRNGLDRFDLVAVCDRNESAARHVADEAEAGLGRRPSVHADLAGMLGLQTGLDGVNIVTDTRTHHELAETALAAGKHVAIEKPMAITVRAGRRIIEAARRAGRRISVSENFRRDPLVRLAKAALAACLIGAPRLLLDISLQGSRSVQQTTAWRHMKLRGGWLLDSAVHDADLIAYLLGDVTEVAAATALWEPVRAMIPADAVASNRAREIAGFYHHRVKETEDGADSISATADDAAFALLRFASGAIGQFTCSIAVPGAAMECFAVYGAGGSLVLPGNRTGHPLQLTPFGRSAPLVAADLRKELPAFRLDETTTRLFGGESFVDSYSLSFAEIDRKLIAIELTDFADAIMNDRPPEIDGEAGLAAVAFVYAILESGHARQPVELAAVHDDRVNAYQNEISASVGL